MNAPPNHRLTPKLVESLAGYSRQRFIADLIAGVTVGLVALPLAMAFAISSGVRPEAGIYTAIIAGFIVSALGGSRCQIAGPTGAFVVIVAGIVAEFGISGLLMCTAMAGVMLLLMGLTGLGSAVRYIPRPVTIGFTNGIAVLIASTQIKDFFGLAVDEVPSEFARMIALGKSATTFGMPAVIVSVTTVAIILLWPRVTRKLPGTIIALLATTAACVFAGIHVGTIGSRFGGIPTGLPPLSFPEFRADLILPLLPSAFTVAMLSAIESLLSAVVADNMSGDRHKPDAELVAQGLANLAVPFFGGIPATGAIARTATNIRSGATSPVSGIVHSLTLLAIVVAAAPLAKYVPLPTLAAILMVVAYRMGEWHAIPSILHLSAADRLVWAATFLLTVFADLTVAVEVGMVLAALLYIHRVSATTTVASITDDDLQDGGGAYVLTDKYIPAYVSVVRIRGPFLFGATEKLEHASSDVNKFQKIVVLKLTQMTAIDGTGIHAFESLAARLQEVGRPLIVCGAQSQPAEMIGRSKLVKLIGRQNMQPHLDAALERAAIIHGGFDDPRARATA